MILRRCLLALMVLGLAGLNTGCGSLSKAKPPPITAPAARAPDQPSPPAVKRADGYSRYGTPGFYEVNGQRYEVLQSGTDFVERGIASWYGEDFHGKLTSNREVYDMYQMTAAHKLLPLPTWVEVTNLENGRKVVLRVNDRGPFKDNRVIDLSYAAALKLEVIQKGTAFVEVRALERPDEVETNAASASAPDAHMFLQVGAFGDRDNAERQKVLLTAAIHQPIRVFEDRTGGRVLYKVQVGPISDVDQADQVVSLLDAAGVAEHHFVNQ